MPKDGLGRFFEHCAWKKPVFLSFFFTRVKKTYIFENFLHAREGNLRF
jgi:hypothetical protein